MVEIHHYGVRLTADPARVVIRPFHISPDNKSKAQQSRPRRIVDAVLAMSVEQCEHALAVVDHDFETRHWQTSRVYLKRYAQVMHDLGLNPPIGEAHKELIGAYFCHEYSYAAAAIMNPSIVPHPDQSGLMRKGDQKFILSLRTVGEGHISSIAFREGILSQSGELTLWPQPDFSMAADSLETEPEGEVVARRPSAAPISGTVLFPFTRAQRNGLEDLRLVRFVEDDGEVTYYGAYTAYSGFGIASEMLETKDFNTFRLSPMQGDAARNKGMALFPRRIGGAYAMIGRQDGESMFFMQSDEVRAWQGGEKLFGPKYPWELVRIGNCGAPIEIDEGWLLLTHGVGAMRKYAIGAVLLDRQDPRKVLGRMPEPLLAPSQTEREGYVPNVLYTCGALRHGQSLFLPYGVADSSVSFAMIDLPSLVAQMR
jgi:predicted GH43/DUF377 family glycosyl hydrolase